MDALRNSCVTLQCNSDYVPFRKTDNKHEQPPVHQLSGPEGKVQLKHTAQMNGDIEEFPLCTNRLETSLTFTVTQVRGRDGHIHTRVRLIKSQKTSQELLQKGLTKLTSVSFVS